GLQGLGRTNPDGHTHATRWQLPWLEEQLEQVRRGSQRRGDDAEPEINALVQIVAVTDDPEPAYASVCKRIADLTIDDARTTPYLLVGTTDEIASKIDRLATEYSIRYFAVRALEQFAPVIRELR